MSLRVSLHELRKEYRLARLDPEELLESPIELFENWLEYAVLESSDLPDACTLATVSSDLRPDVRIVLLKQFDLKGAVFFTNYESAKGQQLQQNPQASLLFWWPKIERQVRMSGWVEKINPEDSDAYFASRPIGSQIAAAVSNQSQILDSKQALEEKYSALSKQLSGKPPKRPESWGGYRLKPDRFEFWQGRENRLHDRVRYRYVNGKWIHEWLNP